MADAVAVADAAAGGARSAVLLSGSARDHGALAPQLARAGFDVSSVRLDAPDLEAAGHGRLVILDLDLAERAAPERLDAVLTGLRPAAVMVLTPDVPLAARLHAYDAGADDVVVLPCSPQEVVARARALARRVAPAPGRAPADERVPIGDVVLDLGARAVVRGGREQPLRPKEFALLRALLRHEGEVVSREDLLDEVWGWASEVTTRTVDTHVARLRRHIERVPSDPQLLLTVSRSGYRLVRPPEQRRRRAG